MKDSTQTVVVPVIEEVAEVGRQAVEAGRVRISKHVRQRQEVVDQAVVTEEVVVERVPVNRVISGPVEPREEDGVLIVPVVEEVLVVEKRLVLKEEVRISRRRTESRQPQTVTLRAEDVEIQRIPPGRQGEGT